MDVCCFSEWPLKYTNNTVWSEKNFGPSERQFLRVTGQFNHNTSSFLYARILVLSAKFDICDTTLFMPTILKLLTKLQCFKISVLVLYATEKEPKKQLARNFSRIIVFKKIETNWQANFPIKNERHAEIYNGNSRRVFLELSHHLFLCFPIPFHHQHQTFSFVNVWSYHVMYVNVCDMFFTFRQWTCTCVFDVGDFLFSSYFIFKWKNNNYSCKSLRFSLAWWISWKNCEQ